MNKQLLLILLFLFFTLSFPASAQAESVETASANLTGTETGPTPETQPTIRATLAEGHTELDASPVPPMWRLAIGLVLVIGAELAARFLKNRRTDPP